MTTRVARVVRVNAGNRQPMIDYARSIFASRMQETFFATKYEMKKKFHISDRQSSRLTWDIWHRYNKSGKYKA